VIFFYVQTPPTSIEIARITLDIDELRSRDRTWNTGRSRERCIFDARVIQKLEKMSGHSRQEHSHGKVSERCPCLHAVEKLHHVIGYCKDAGSELYDKR
jgi:hypothetical protein